MSDRTHLTTSRHCARHVLLLALAVLIGGLLGWRQFLTAPLSIDEHVSFWIADDSGPSTLWSRSLDYSATPPLSFAVQWMSLQLFGEREWALRLSSAVAFAGTLSAVWWVGFRMAGPIAGGLAALLLAVHPGLDELAVAGRPYSLGLLLGLLVMIWTDRIVQSGPTLFHLSLWGLLNLLLIQTHYLFGALWAAQLVWLGSSRRLSRRDKLAACGILLALLMTVMPGLLRVWHHRAALNWTTQPPSVAELWRLVLPIDPASLRRPAVWILGAVMVAWQAAVYRGHVKQWFDPRHWRLGRRLLGWAIVWLVLPAGILWLLGRFWIASLGAERYRTICLPAAALLWGGLLPLLRGRAAPILAAMLLMLLQGAGPRLTAALPWTGIDHSPPGRGADADWMRVGQRLSEASPSPELVLVGSGLAEMSLVPLYADDLVFQDYVCSRLGRMYRQRDIARLSLPMFWPPLGAPFYRLYRQAVSRNCESVNRADEDAGTIWLVAATDTDLLRRSLENARGFLRSLGAVEVRSFRQGTVRVVIYSCPQR